MAHKNIDIALESTIQNIITQLGLTADKATIDSIYQTLQDNSSSSSSSSSTSSTGVVKSVQHCKVTIHYRDDGTVLHSINRVKADKSFIIYNGFYLNSNRENLYDDMCSLSLGNEDYGADWAYEEYDVVFCNSNFKTVNPEVLSGSSVVVCFSVIEFY